MRPLLPLSILTLLSGCATDAPHRQLGWVERRSPTLDALVADGAHSLADVLVGACAASASVCLMIPLDTVKVRMTTGNLGGVAYRNVADAIRTMLREEGAFCFYRGLPPRL